MNPAGAPVEVALLAVRIAVVLALYVFLFAVARALRADLRAATVASTVSEPPAGWLEVVECDGAPDLAGKVFAFESGSSIGRALDNDVVIQEPRVSTQHARLLWRQGHWWLEDLDSSNGTFVNEERVSRPTAVEYGDALRLGPALLRLQPSSDP